MGKTTAIIAIMKLLLAILLGVIAAASANQCGRKGYGSRIIGGVDAGHGEFPWQISLQFNSPRGQMHICGGTLLNKRWVLCAAHCFGQSQNPGSYKIRTGEWHLKSRDGTERDIPVRRIDVHSQFNSPKQFQHDIALLELAQDADLSGPYVGTACLPPAGKDYRGHSDCYLSGWGLMVRNPPTPANTLQKINGKIWTASAAAQQWGQYKPPDTVCFGNPGVWSACMGDSGGPLVCGNGAGGFDVIGIVSFGPGTCAEKPGVFTEVSKFIPWITQRIGGSVVEPTDRPIIDPPRPGGGVKACQSAGPLVAHENDCSKYYQCTGRGSGILGSCGAGLRFNKAIGNCDWASNVQC